jgi:hypothetical protein
MTEERTEQERIDFQICANVEARLPETLRDIIQVMNYFLVKDKTELSEVPTEVLREVAAAHTRLREMAQMLESYKRITPPWPNAKS